ncbi:MAG: DNA-binding LytR/AlgR family response regulator [Flammeovirgaceae bacterium]|jgi:DNA-binding LytR/AlgR family response regulator
MNFLIVEDEEQAAKRLKRMISSLVPDAFIHGPCESIEEAVQWLSENPKPDLAFFDIHLADGLSFEIGEKVEVSCPIIFTTAYDQYAIRAFKLNSVDYLLKPIGEEDLSGSIEKFKSQFLNHPVKVFGNEWPAQIRADYENKYKKRFVTRVGDRLQTLEVADAAFAYSENKGTYLRSKEGKNYLVDYTLEQVAAMLDTVDFFRLNRKYIARFEAVEEMVSYSNSRLKVKLQNWEDQDIVLSREKTKEFKEWLDR